MADRIKLSTVIDTLQALAEEFPDKVDPRVDRGLPPRYVEHGEPVCLVAVLLHRLGYSVEHLKQLNREGSQAAQASSGGVVFGRSRNPLLRRISPVARNLLDAVQAKQDRGGYYTWKRVVAETLTPSDFDRYWMARKPERVDPWKHEIMQRAATPEG